MKKIFLILTVISIMFSCEELKEGFIVDKYITESYKSTTYIMVGKILMPTTSVVPTKYYFIIDGTMEKGLKVDGYKKQVSKNVYDEYKINDYIVFELEGVKR